MWNLAWPYRRKLIFEELEEAQGDIVCLQEVQADHYESDINPFMQQLGYDGIYKGKSRDFVGQYGKVIDFHLTILYLFINLLHDKSTRSLIVCHCPYISVCALTGGWLCDFLEEK